MSQINPRSPSPQVELGADDVAAIDELRRDYQRVTSELAKVIVDGEAVEQTVNGTVRQIDPGVQISLDRNGEKLMVTTHERGHKMVQEVVARFKPYDRKRLRIFQLSWMSPLEAHGAIDRMITSEISDHQQRPDVHPDDNLQQLWVRGTDAQLKEIEDLENTLREERANHKKEVKELEEETKRLKVSRFIWKLSFDRTKFSLHFSKFQFQNISSFKF